MEERVDTQEEPFKLIQDKNFLRKHGLIMYPGPEDNTTDCLSDKIYHHFPTGEEKRFVGSFWDDEYVNEIYEWVLKYNEIEQ